MKKLLFVFALAVVSIAGFTQSPSKIEKELREEMNIRGEDELIRINIIMEAQYDQFELRRKSDGFLDKEEKRDFVIKELKNYSKYNQTGVTSVLKDYAQRGKVENVKQYWIFDGVNCYATAEVINELSTRSDIEIIGFDREQCLIPANEIPTEADNTREITSNITKVNADDVWDLGYTGEGVIVAVIDTGVNYNHSDVSDHMWDNPDYPNHGFDFYNNDNNPMDDMGHGTHCAGTVAGDGTGGSQTGAAPDATIMAVKVLNSSGNGSISNICDGIEFAVEQGAHVISMSLGFYGGGSTAERIQFRNTMIGVLEAGVVGSIAAGNEGTSVGNLVNIRVPGNCPPPWFHPDQTLTGGMTCVVCIGATDSNDAIAYFSSRGPVTWQAIDPWNDYAYTSGSQTQIGLIRPDVCAPGVDIKSLNYTGSGYTTMSGTSMATPCVAGVMALMLSKNMYLTPAEIDEILETTAVPLSTSKSNVFGSGRIDALAAVNEIAIGPILLNTVVLNDNQGNGNGLLNPGESVTLNVSMENNSEAAVNNVSVTMSSDNQYVTITDATETYGNFTAGEIKNINNAFAFSLAADAPALQNVKFVFTAYTPDDTCRSSYNFMTYDYILAYQNMTVLDPSGNNDGILDPGETADLRIVLGNNGNADVDDLSALLSTQYSDLAINSATATYGDIAAGATAYADFNVTLASTVVPGNIIIPFNMIAEDASGRTSNFAFNYYMGQCEMQLDLHDSFGDGWNGASILATFSDGSPSQTYTLNSGSNGSFTTEISGGTTITFTWQSGSWDSECSFEIYYVDGDNIYSSSGTPSAGAFYSFVVNCSGTVSGCSPVQNLEAAVDGSTVELSWQAPEEGTPTRYDIYRGSSVIGTTATLGFVIDNAPSGVSQYCVLPIFTDCATTAECVSVNVIVLCDPVRDLTATLGLNREVTASWTEPEDATGLVNYIVDVDGEETGTTTETTFTSVLESGNHTIEVKAAFDDGCISDPLAVEIAVIDCFPPASLQYNVSFVAGVYTLNITWTTPETTPTPSSYIVYADDVVVETTTENNYQTVIEPGVYSYCISAVYDGYCTSNTVCEDIEIADYPCAPVRNLEATQQPAAQIVVLSWTAPEDYAKGILNYGIYLDDVFNAETTEQTYTVENAPLGVHEYGVTVRYEYECDETEMSYVSLNIEGLENIHNDTKVFPVPASSEFIVEGENITSLALYNSMGQLVKTMPVNSVITVVDVSDLKQALYLLNIYYEDGNASAVRITVSR